MKYDSSKFSQNNANTSENNQIEQYFGKGNVFEQEKLAGGAKPYEPKKKEINPYGILSIIKDIPIQKKQGYTVLMITLVILLVWFILQMPFDNLLLHMGNFLGTLFLVAVTYIVWQKVSFSMHDVFYHYLSNATLTWKALIEQIPLIKQALPYSKEILFWSVIGLAIQKLILDFFLLPISTIIGGASMIGLLIGIALAFATKQFDFANQVLRLFCMVLLIELLLYGIIASWYYPYMFAFTGFQYLFFWTLSVFMEEWSTIEGEKKRKKNGDRTGYSK